MLPNLFWLTPDRFDLKQDKSSWLEMCRNLKQLGWPAQVVAARSTQSGKDSSDFDSVQFVPSLNLPYVFRLSAMLSIFWFLFRNSRKGDVFVINDDMMWWIPVFRLLGKRHIHLDIRTVPLSAVTFKLKVNNFLFWSLPTKLLARTPDSYSFITQGVKAAFDQAAGSTTKDYCLWASGVNTGLFKPARSAPQSPSKRFNVFYHGSISATRGLPELIEAFTDQRVPANVDVTIVGDGPDRPMLMRLADELGVSNRVFFKGFVPYSEVPEYINQADVCICPLPDLAEWNVSSPLKVMEYMACNKPVILTPIAAHKEIAAHCAFVLWSTGSRPEELAEAMVRAERSIEELSAAAEGAREFVISRFEWRAHAATLDRHLRCGHVDERAPR